jgi:hypothetical protein
VIFFEYLKSWHLLFTLINCIYVSITDFDTSWSKRHRMWAYDNDFHVDKIGCHTLTFFGRPVFDSPADNLVPRLFPLVEERPWLVLVTCHAGFAWYKLKMSLGQGDRGARLQNYNLCSCVCYIFGLCNKKSGKISYLLWHDFLYIIECWVTLVKREVGSDFSGHNAFGNESTLRYENTMYKCKNLLDRPIDPENDVVTLWLLSVIKGILSDT